jgi:NADH-quinone oxidoreductase subunit J
MSSAVWLEWAAFVVLSLIAILGALGMTTTMSMFRSGIFLMASFVGVAGLFVFLGADLIGLLQVMMYVGGMLVMILFMVLFSNDPGGMMMTSHMKLPAVERWFSSGLGHMKESESGGGDMSMFTGIKRGAAILAALAGAALVGMVALDRPWVESGVEPAYPSADRVGHLLMGKYMIAFEGAGLLILLGIFAAVYLQRPGRRPSSPRRERLSAAVDAPPVRLASDRLRPLAPRPSRKRRAKAGE